MGRFLYGSLIFLLLATPLVPAEKGNDSPDFTISPVVNIDEAGWKRVLNGHKGRVLVVNFWATWCEPCREEFPGIVKLYRKYKDRGLDVVSISMDEPESRSEVEEFLRSYGAAFPTYLHHFEDFAALVDSINPDWIGGLPATFIYDRQGKLRHSYQGAVHYEEFEKAVTPLLEASGVMIEREFCSRSRRVPAFR